MRDLDHKPMENRRRNERAIAPSMAHGSACGIDRFGVKTLSNVLPESLQKGIHLVMHQGAS